MSSLLDGSIGCWFKRFGSVAIAFVLSVGWYFSAPTLAFGAEEDAEVKTVTQDTLFYVSPQNIEHLDELIPRSINITEGKYSGQISLDLITPYTVEGVYESKSSPVDKAVLLEGLNSNDAEQIAQFRSFEVRSDAALDATVSKDLELTSVEFFVSQYTSLDLPAKYSAALVYRGTEDYLTAISYEVTAHYQGEISSEPDTSTVTTPITQKLADTPTPLSASHTDYSPYIAAAAVAILAGFFFWFMVFYRNIELVRRDKSGSDVLFKRHGKVSGGICKVAIPDHINLMDGAKYEFILKPPLANADGYLVVYWRGFLINQELLQRNINMNLQEILAKDTVVALSDEILAFANV